MTNNALNISLFDVEDVTAMPKVRDMNVGPATSADCKEFARRYHYTGDDASSWRWGLWHGPVLHGVIGFNVLTKNVSNSVFGPEHWQHVWHMSRLILSDDSPRNSESRLIGGTLKLIEKQHPGVWAVLSYAAVHANHIGTVYQATNALYTGLAAGGECMYIDRDGVQRSRRSLDIEKHGGISLAERASAKGWKRIEVPKKHRYVYILGTQKQRRIRRRLLRFAVCPYPKEVKA